MAKILLMYYSRTGNTEKMARLIADGIYEVEGVELILKPIALVSVNDWVYYDGIIIGAPVYYGTAPWEVKKALDESVSFHGKLKGKLGGAFASSANVGGGNETTCLGVLQAWLIHGMLVMGDHEGDHYGPVSVTAPDERAVKNCKNYGKVFAETTKKLFG